MAGEDSGGGSLVLAGLIDQAGEAIYQDFREVYSANLIEMIRDDTPPREILLLLRGLQPGSRFLAVLQGSKEFEGWNVLAYQIANLLDAVNYVSYAVVAANSGKRKPKAPKPSFRPSKAGRRKTNAFAAQLEMAKQRKARGG